MIFSSFLRLADSSYLLAVRLNSLPVRLSRLQVHLSSLPVRLSRLQEDFSRKVHMIRCFFKIYGHSSSGISVHDLWFFHDSCAHFYKTALKAAFQRAKRQKFISVHGQDVRCGPWERSSSRCKSRRSLTKLSPVLAWEAQKQVLAVGVKDTKGLPWMKE